MLPGEMPFADDDSDNSYDVSTTKTLMLNDVLKEENQYLKSEIKKLKEALESEKIFRLIYETSANVSDIRQLPFLHKVEYKIISESDFKEILQRKIAEEYPDELIASEETALKMLGAIPGDFKFKEFFIDLMLEQAAGVYDEDTSTLYVMKKYNLGDNIIKIILSHELTHALQDQHFSIDNMPLEDKTNSDSAFAALCILEGDAMLVMSEYIAKNVSMEYLFELPKMLMMDQTKIQNAPSILLKTLLTPYLQGMVFVQTAQFESNMKGRNDLFVNLPLSSEQILHPEKYFHEIDSPTTITLKDLSSDIGSGWKRVYSNVMGEIGILGILEAYPDIKAGEAASGWDGDRLELYNGAKNNSLLIWQSVWDTNDDSKEFFDSFQSYIKKRFRVTRSEKQLFKKGTIFSGITMQVKDTKQYISIWTSKNCVRIMISTKKIEPEFISGKMGLIPELTK